MSTKPWLRRGIALAASLAFAACAASPAPAPAEDGGIVEPAEDGGAEAEDGVDVRILWDAVQAESNSNDDLYRVLIDGGIDITKIRIDGGSGLAEMHNKFAVVDDTRVMTGSMNWSVTGLTQNHEHLLTLP